MWITIQGKNREEFNQLATHPLQSFEWGEFREKNGIKVIRKGYANKPGGKLTQAFQLTIHPISHTAWTIGYLPKGTMPTKELIAELQNVGKEEKCIFIQIEPNVTKIQNSEFTIQNLIKNSEFKILNSFHPLFTKYTLQIDLTKSDEELLQNMHPKARYNIKVAKKHDVIITEENTQEAFNQFWHLTEETTKRQKFFAHTKAYHMTQWNTLPHVAEKNTLSSHLLLARYQGQPLTAWIVFLFKDLLYYPYGASSQDHRETMHSTAMMWEAIQFGKKHHAKVFDLWGAAAPGTPESDPWFGFTQFKERFGPQRVEFIGSFDIVIHPLLYKLYCLADMLRWFLLRFT